MEREKNTSKGKPDVINPLFKRVLSIAGRNRDIPFKEVKRDVTEAVTQARTKQED